MPFWNEYLLRIECKYLGLVWFSIEDPAVSDDNAHDEEGAGQISPEGDEPVHQHLGNGQASLQDGDGGGLPNISASEQMSSIGSFVKAHHEATSTEISTSDNNHRQAKREDDRSNHAYQSRGVLLVPRRSIGAQRHGASEGKQHTGHDGRHEDLVDAHVGFVDSRAAGELDCLAWCVGIDDDMEVVVHLAALLVIMVVTDGIG